MIELWVWGTAKRSGRFVSLSGQRVSTGVWAPGAAAGKVAPFSAAVLYPEVKVAHPEVKGPTWK